MPVKFDLSEEEYEILLKWSKLTGRDEATTAKRVLREWLEVQENGCLVTYHTREEIEEQEQMQDQEGEEDSDGEPTFD